MKHLAVVLALVAALAATGCDPPPPTTYANDTWVRVGAPTDALTGPELDGYDEDNMAVCAAQPASGSWTISAANTVVEGCRITTKVRANAPGIVLRDVVVAVGGTDLLVQVLGPGSGLVIENSVIGPPAGAPPWPLGVYGETCSADIGFGNYTIRRSELHGCTDAGKIAGTVVVEDSFIHDEDVRCGGPASDPCTHNDAFQKDLAAGTLNLTLTGNAMYRTRCKGNRHVMIEGWPATGASQVTISRNFFYGSHGVLHTKTEPGPNVTGTIDTNFYAGTLHAGPFSAQPVGPRDLFTGGFGNIVVGTNYFEDGTVAPGDGALATDYVCGETPRPGEEG